MARMVERHVTEFMPTMRAASLIEAPSYDPDKMAAKNMHEEFRLPWNSVFIEDDQSGVLIQRRGRVIVAGNSWRPDPDKERRWTTGDVGIERMDLFRFGVVFSDKFNGREIITPCGYFSEMCVIDILADGRIFWGTGGINVVIGGGTIVIGPGHEKWAECSKTLVDNITAALNQCCMVTRPSNWIVKRVPTAQEEEAIARRANHAVKVARSHERDRWLLITDAERARAFREPSAVEVSGNAQERRDVTPHPRRAHYRHIGQNEDGSKRHTWVRACWVGSKEAEIRGARYRVELDL